jgi:hypothetical protein
MNADLKLFCENLESEKNALGKTFEDWRRGILNASDFQKALRKATRFLVDKKEVIWQEKQKLENRLSTESGNIFKCLNDTFISYSKAYEIAYQASLHDTTEKTNICYQKVQESSLLLMDAVHFLEGYREYHETKNRFIELKKMLGSERLLKLLTIQMTEFLFRQVDEFWSKSVYQEGKIVLQICRQRLSDLLRKISEADKQEELEKRLEKIYRLAVQAEAFISGKKIADFKELTPIQNLVKTGFFVLAERLINDLEHLFTSCRMFFQEYDAYQNFLNEGNPPVISTDEIRRFISEAGWESAFCRLSAATLKAYTEKLTDLNFQTAANNLKLAEKFKTQTS